ncbi:hypothetical protein NHX12_005856 [Muraenolepis orangiensis]|uniref:GTP-binding protein n=1 Tax=Muraenolepis orangiensis TaxID=630683 RepID=A0A9Q0DVU0_9TELE|nr:hypothetical protein NHX12_005856 [Muraenolepis orangiensis]
MTLNKGDKKLRNMERRRGSAPFPAHLPNPHRRSMPVDDRELRASVPSGQAADELSSGNLLRCAYSSTTTAYSSCPGGEQPHLLRDSRVSDSSDSVISSGSDAEQSPVYKVVLLGEHGVGKSSLARIFGGVEEAHDSEEAGETRMMKMKMIIVVSVVVSPGDDSDKN